MPTELRLSPFHYLISQSVAPTKEIAIFLRLNIILRADLTTGEAVCDLSDHNRTSMPVLVVLRGAFQPLEIEHIKKAFGLYARSEKIIVQFERIEE